MLFTLNSKTYVKIDSIAMECPLGTVLAHTFLVDLEENIVPTLSNDILL